MPGPLNLRGSSVHRYGEGPAFTLRGSPVHTAGSSMAHPMMRHSPAPAKMGKGKRMLEAAMREVHEDEPSTVTRANVKGKKKEAMLRAIAFSKARKRGAKLPKG